MSEITFPSPRRLRLPRLASSSLGRYLARRLLLTVITVFLISITVFVITNILPGNPALVRLGPLGAQDPAALAEMERRMGLDKPLLERYGSFVGNALQGDLGQSFETERPVIEDLKDKFPATIELALFATLLATLVGVPLGFAAAIKRDSKLDHAVRNLSGVSAAMPIFWLALILSYVFAFQLKWAPGPTGRLAIGEQPPEGVFGFYTLDALIDGDLGLFRSALGHLALPAVTLAVIELAPITKMARSAMLEIMQTDYVRTSRSLGFSSWQVVRGDALRNALVPILTTIGIVLGYLVAGAVVVEFIYSWPGIGQYAFSSVSANDFNAIQGVVLTIAIVYVVLNLLIDVLYGVIDPRIRLG